MSAADPRTIALLGLIEQYRAAGSSAWIVAAGRSMAPTIPPHTRLLVAFGRTPERIGQLVVFRRGDLVVAHRLVGRRVVDGAERLLVKGDGEALLDPLLATRDTLGIVVAAEDRSGRPIPLDDPAPRARLVAHVSRLSGRAAGAGMRLARRAPSPLRGPVRTVALNLSRVPTRLITAPTPGLDRGASGREEVISI